MRNAAHQRQPRQKSRRTKPCAIFLEFAPVAGASGSMTYGADTRGDGKAFAVRPFCQISEIALGRPLWQPAQFSGQGRVSAAVEPEPSRKCAEHEPIGAGQRLVIAENNIDAALIEGMANVTLGRPHNLLDCA